MSCSLKENILRFDRAVPRYTSYPTAPNFKSVDETLSNPYKDITANDHISLYIHVPFCAQMCWYCGCHTKVTKHYEPIHEYVGYILKEIELVSAQLNCKASVSHIHFGGGSPGLLLPEDFDSIMSKVRGFFNVLDEAEIAIEIDPRGVTEARVASYAKNGINRVSLGSQDFNDKVMDSVNRSQPYELSLNTVKLFRQYGIDNINLDLIYGLPHQDVQSTINTINLALTLNPDRIAFFGYAHVPWMKKHMRLIDEKALPDKTLRFDLFNTGAKILEDNGYVAVGIDHFVKPDDPMASASRQKILRRNFQGYTTDKAEIMIGLGVSSIGKTHEAYYQNTADMPVYKNKISEGNLPIIKSCPITEDDKIRGKIIERIMCDFEIDLSDYEGDYYDEIEACRPYAESGLIDIQNTKIILSMRARPIARLVAAAFDRYLPPATEQKHSKAV